MINISISRGILIAQNARKIKLMYAMVVENRFWKNYIQLWINFGILSVLNAQNVVKYFKMKGSYQLMAKVTIRNVLN